MAEAFQYAVLRLVPSIERGERINVAVVLHCRRLKFLGMRHELDHERARAIAPDCDLDRVGEQLASIAELVAGERGEGALAKLPQSELFGWITAPSSTIIQPSEVHTGLTDDPAGTLERLFSGLVKASPEG